MGIKNRIFAAGVALALATASLTAAAQTCRDTILKTAPDNAFTLRDDGTAIHKTTGLMWMRCSLGQDWKGAGCTGEAKTMNWGEALNAADNFEYSGFSDWRLPNKNELESLVEEACVSPAINVNAFPATPPVFFWTSSPYAGQALGAWSVDFGYGTVSATVKTGKSCVRLVREVKW